MSIGQKSFLFFIFFILGVLAASFPVGLWQIIAGGLVICLSLLFVSFFKSDRRLLAVGFLTLAITAGAIYERGYEYIKFRKHLPAYNIAAAFSGTVDSYPQQSAKSQGFVFKTDGGTTLFVRTDKFQQIAYGDIIKLQGMIKSIDDASQYLKRDGVVGIILFPKITNIQPSSNFSLKRTLYSFRDSFTDVFKKTLNTDEAALMAGILLGQESADFPADFKQAMKNSGTTHITALSGYNITILISALFYVLGFLFSRKATFWISIASIILFVMMTGAQSSVIRAAFMGSLVIVAQRLSRVYSFKQAMAVTGFAMVVFNPMILRFDAGFVLSFLSLAGITYIAPIAGSFVNFKKEWAQKIKKLFFETFSAQAAVLPVLAAYFGGFSAVGVVSNILVLPLIPITMGIGFFAGILGFLWMPLAHIASFVLTIPLSFEVWAINFFGSFSQIKMELGITFAAVYYLALLVFILRYKKRLEINEYIV